MRDTKIMPPLRSHSSRFFALSEASGSMSVSTVGPTRLDKTPYCTPLALPFPVEIRAGTRVHQSITLRLAGTPSSFGEGREEAAQPGVAELTLPPPADPRPPIPGCPCRDLPVVDAQRRSLKTGRPIPERRREQAGKGERMAVNQPAKSREGCSLGGQGLGFLTGSDQSRIQPCVVSTC